MERRTRIFPMLAAILLLTACEEVPSNREFFSEFCDISIPETATIVLDETGEKISGTDRHFELNLTADESAALLESIRRSAYFTKLSHQDEKGFTKVYVEAGGKKASWVRYNKCYFFRNEGEPHFMVKVDTVKRIAKFKELEE